MATTSFLYHTMGVRGYRLQRCEFRGGVARHHVQRSRQRRRCRGCGAGWQELRFDGAFERTFVGPPIGRHRQEIVLHGHVQRCRRCNRTLREPIPFACGKQRMLRVMARLIVDLCHIATIKDTAAFLGLDWDLVKEVFKAHLRRQLRKRSLARVRLIAVDEFALRKGNRYMTVVLDLLTGDVLYSAQGRSADALIPFLYRLKQAHAPLQAVAVDMWPAYTLAITTMFPRVCIVHDPFHIVQLVNRAIDNAQRELAAHLPKSLRCRRGLRFVLLRAHEHLDQTGHALLRQLMALNQPLYQAYLLKEQLRALWSQTNIDTASRFLDQWIDQAFTTGLRAFKQLAKTLRAHAAAILAWYHHRISTGPLEGLNNKAKVLKRQAYGFRDIEYFQLRLAFIHSSAQRFPG